jgi:plastocyanin
MEIQTVTVETAGPVPDDLIAALEAHRIDLRARPGFRSASIARSDGDNGDSVLTFESRWRDNNTLADYSTVRPNAESIINEHAGSIVAGSLRVRRSEVVGEDEEEDLSGPMFERLAFALFVPIGILTFALLVIYGLSRIYLSLNPDVATPVAAVIAIGILAICAMLAANPVVSRVQVTGIVVFIGALLLGGGIYAGVHGKHREETPTSVSRAATQTAQASAPTTGKTPTAPVGGGLVISTPDDTRFDKDTLTTTAGADVTVTYTNDSNIVHNIHFFAGNSTTSGTLQKSALKAGPGDVQTLSFKAPTAPGQYLFHCDAHPQQMIGHLVVQ